jgi:hypothetical protein
VSFPVVGVGAVALKTFVGKDGADVEVKADFSVVVGAVVMQAGGENEDCSCDQGKYGGNATDGSRFTLKVR